jgi:hypothetical protein
VIDDSEVKPPEVSDDDSHAVVTGVDRFGADLQEPLSYQCEGDSVIHPQRLANRTKQG